MINFRGKIVAVYREPQGRLCFKILKNNLWEKGVYVCSCVDIHYSILWNYAYHMTGNIELSYKFTDQDVAVKITTTKPFPLSYTYYPYKFIGKEVHVINLAPTAINLL